MLTFEPPPCIALEICGLDKGREKDYSKPVRELSFQDRSSKCVRGGIMTPFKKSALVAVTILGMCVSCSKNTQNANADIQALASQISSLQAEISKMNETQAQEATPAAPAAPTATAPEPQTTVSREPSFIRITNPEDGDERYLYNVTNVNEVNLQFTGAVSSDCEKIRVLWAPDSADYIQAYLEGRTQKIRNIPIDDYVLSKFTPGDTSFVYNVGGKLDNLQQGSNYYRFIATFKDGSTQSYSLSYFVYCGGAAEKAKPVIYLYPQKKTNVTVSVLPQGGLTESIPEMGKAWKVTAYPDGRIVERKNKQEYPYLYWESADVPSPIDLREGFVVAQNDVQAFFEEKLSLLGLNQKEIADFTEYWVPELGGSAYVFITFYSQERIEKEAPLTVSPKPDSVIRVYFDHKKLDEPIETTEQTLTPAKRSGFAVVEWGGRRYK